MAVVLTLEGKRFVTDSRDHTVRVWDAKTGRETLLLKATKDHGPVYSFAFSPNGKLIVSGHANGISTVCFSD